MENYKYNNFGKLNQIMTQISEQTAETAKNKRFSLNLGGDHSIAAGTIGGLNQIYDDLKIIWVDAHIDHAIPEWGVSKNFHGKPISALTGFIEKYPILKLVPEKNIVWIGIRHADYDEKEIIKQHDLKVFTIDDIEELGMKQVMDQTFEYLGDKPTHISFDIDSLDPQFAPHTGTLVSDGMTMREANYLIRRTVGTKNLVSMDLVEVNPLRNSHMKDNNRYANIPVSTGGLANQSATCAVELIASALGHRLS